jgi:uncharacterized protein YndB with AHSA1/START domain
MKTEPIVVEKTMNAPAEKVWEAITDNKKMKSWYFDIDEFRAEPGFEFSFYGGDEKTQYLHLCRVIEVIPGKKLSYRWAYDNVPGESIVTFELFPEGDKTLVRLTHSGTESFRTDDPNFSRESATGGWNHIIGTSLKDFVERESK